MQNLPKEIFKAYDIRGIVGKTLTPEVVEAIGHAVGSEATAREQSTIAIGRDGRLSGPELIAALARGIQKSGINVIDVGCVPTPMVYFAAYQLHTDCAVMLTGSHNPPDYNGLKMVLAGETLSGETIQQLRSRIEQNNLTHGNGSYTQRDISADYIARIVSGIKLARPMHVTVDCGNGVAGAYVANLYRQLGCTVQEMYCEVDGHFPNHHPDPSQPENLQDLIAVLRDNDSELGLAFDGDGDRLGVVTKDGKIIYPDRQLMLFAEDVLTRHPGAQILYDVKCTRHLAPYIEKSGGVPLMWKTGHSLVKAKLKETGAPLGGEMSGHIFFSDRWYGFDDGLYAGARLLELLTRVADPSALLNALPQSDSTPELHLELAEGENVALIDKLRDDAFPGHERIITIDGLRVEYADGFGLARSSNTTPVVVMRFEAETPAALARIQAEFKRAITTARPDARLPF